MSIRKMHRHPARRIEEIGAGLRQLRYPPEIRIKSPDRLDEMQVLAADLARLLDWFKEYYQKDVPDRDKEHLQFLDVLSEVCVGIWRSRSKMVDPVSGEVVEAARRAVRPLETTLDLLRQSGFEIRDHTNQTYHTGMPDKVITWEQKEGLDRDTVIETIRPTILYNDKLLKQGEIIVGVPVKTG